MSTASTDLISVGATRLNQTSCDAVQTDTFETATVAQLGAKDQVLIQHNGNDTAGSISTNRLYFIYGKNAVNFSVRTGCADPVPHTTGDYLDITDAAQWPAIVTFDYTPARGANAGVTTSFYFTLQQPGIVKANRLEGFTVHVGTFGPDDDPVCIAQKQKPLDDQESAASLGSSIWSGQVGQMAQHRASQRIQRAMSAGGSAEAGGLI